MASILGNNDPYGGKGAYYIPPYTTTTTTPNAPVSGLLPMTTGASPTGINGQLTSALQALQDAINSGNQKQYDLALAQLMGVFNGQPTLEGKKLAETAREYNLTSGLNLLSDSAKLTGPQDYGDFMRFTGGGKSLYQQVMGGRPSSSAPQGDMEPMDLYALMNKLGMGPGQGGKMPGGGGGGDSDEVSRLVAAIMGGFVGQPGGGGGGTDPATDYSRFPSMANPGDLAYAKSHQAFDPTDYASYLTANGYTPDAGTPNSTNAQNALLDWWRANRESLGSGGAEYPDRPIQGTDQYGNIVYYMPGSGSGFVDAATYQAQAPGGWTNPVKQGPNGGRYRHESAMGVNLTDTPDAGSVPSWLADYMNTLIGLGPDVNRGAAENLGLLHQLGLDSPGGLQTIKNPAGNMAPAYWDQLGPTGQSLLAQAAAQVFGWNPADLLSQINATRPVGAAYRPDSTQAQYAPLGTV